MRSSADGTARYSPQRDRYALYEASVQSVDWEIDFMAATYRKRRGREARLFREDFCSTAALCVAWAGAHADNRAVGIDLDPEPLAWAQEHRLPYAGDAAKRVQLVRADVRTPHRPPVDLACALNFSWQVFHERAQLVRYLKAARAGLKPGGILIMDAFGGDGSEKALVERTRKRGGRTPAGARLRPFTYVWEHGPLDAITRQMRTFIHFELEGGRKMKRAFTYDWRMWTLADLGDIVREVGFSTFDVYQEGGRSGAMQPRRTVDNGDGWVVSIVLER